MFECKYKFELEDSLVSAKYVYKSQKRKQDKIIAVLIPILMLAMVAMLIYDIVKHKSIVWDVILLVALVVLQFMYILMPIMLVGSQKKHFKKNNLGFMDYVQITINENLCTVSFFKDEVEMGKQVLSLKALTSYLEDASRIVLVFNKVEYVCIRKKSLTGGVEKLKEHLKKAMYKSTSKKK